MIKSIACAAFVLAAVPLAAQTTTATSTGTAVQIRPVQICTTGIDAIVDGSEQAETLEASSTPAIGLLYPLKKRLNVSSFGNVGIGLNNAPDKLTVAGTIYSLFSGFRFPDGSVMQTAQLPGPQGPPGNPGPQGPQGPIGDPGLASLNGLTGSNLDLVGAGAATVSASGGTINVNTSVGSCLYGGKTYTSGARCNLEGNEIPCPTGTGFVGSFMTCQADGSWQKGNLLTCVNPWPNPYCGL